MGKTKIVIPSEVLLVEIERRCSVPECNAKNRIGLVKDEARAYSGFECEACAEWNVDALNERDVPEWWDELAVTDLYAVRPTTENSHDTSGEVISRMSENYRHTTDDRHK